MFFIPDVLNSPFQSKKKFERECKEAEKSQINFERLDSDINATKSDVEKVGGTHLQHTYCQSVCQSVRCPQLLLFLLSVTPSLLQCMESRESVIGKAIFIMRKIIPHFSFDIRTYIFGLQTTTTHQHII